MRKLILQMQMSVDGFVSAAEGDIAWQVWDWGDDWTWDDALKKEFNGTFESIDCILLSRKMLEQGYLTHWADTARDHPGNADYAFARKIVDADKIVLTNKLERSKWDRTALASGDFAGEVQDLKVREGEDIIAFGGVGFASSLVAEGLVDEFQLYVNPVALGDGRSIFAKSGQALDLVLTRSTAYDCGVVVNKYVPSGRN